MKLFSKIALDGDERDVLNAFTTLLNTICADSESCSTCPISEACKSESCLPEALELLLSLID